MRLPLALLVATILLAGCTSSTTTPSTTPTSSTTSTGATPSTTTPTTTTSTTPATATSTIPTAPPADDSPVVIGNLTWDSFSLSVSSLEAAETLTAIAHVTNNGASSSSPSFDFAIDSNAPQPSGAIIAGGKTANVTATFNPTVGGDHIMHATYAGHERTLAFHVRAPKFGGFAVAIDPTTPCQVVQFNGTFSNDGDGTANGTVLGVTITDNNQIVSKPSGSVTTIAAGTTPHIVATDAAFHAACNTAPHAYTMDATLYWHNDQVAHLTRNVTL